MNAEAPTLDLTECAQFISFWCKQTGAPHITLTAILPDGPTATTTFTPADIETATAWIARQQGAGHNIYFEANETPAGCVKKPTKGMMQAALCRHADIDPLDEHPYRAEHDRLHKLAAFLHADPAMPPTAVLDSGNGIQPLWAVARQPLTPGIIESIEAENRAIETAVGAAGTHNVDRLLRLPGTLNFPNAKKQRGGRGVTRARLLHFTGGVTYTPAQASHLGAHLQELLAGSDLVRRAAGPKAKRDHNTRSHIAFRKGAALRRQGKTYEEFCDALRNDPETADWVREKGDRNGGRELRRIWDHVEGAEEVDNLIDEFNDKYMVVNENGKALIYAPTRDRILRRHIYNRMSVADLRLLHQNRKVGGIPATTVWLNHDCRRQFISGVVFDPSGTPTPPDTLNLWQGFAVAPKPGTWEKLRTHVRDVICSGNIRHYNYVISWLARMVQYPAQQGEVAIVMRGAEGTGKGTLARAMMRILGQHALHISNAKHLVGNFNAHLRDCVLLFADEAFYAGDKAHVGVLKSLITEPYLTIEGKYLNAAQTANVLHIMMASNEDWVVPASLEARRFCVLVVSDAHKDDHAYFAEIWAEMEAGGYAAMLHDLLNIDLTNFNVRRVPVTDGLQQQKKLSLDTTNSWWIDVLHRGYVFRSKLGLEEFFSQWFEEATTELLYVSYIDYAKARHERHPLGRETFGRYMASLGHKPHRSSNLASGEHVTNIEYADGRNGRKAQPICLPRPHAYRLGTLGQARDAFTQATGLTIEWP